jgi:hypothetical protein
MVDYTDYQQRALYGAGQSAARAQQRFHMEENALRDGDIAAAKYHRSRANALNRQGAYAAVRGMGGDQGENQYFPVQSSGQPTYSTNFPGQFALSSKGRDVFDKFRDTGFIEPIRQKKRYAPNTEPRGLGWLIDQGMKNTMFAKMASAALPKKAPEPDDVYYSSLWGKGLNELYGPSGIFTMGEFLGKPDPDPYYTDEADIPRDYSSFIESSIEPIIEDEVEDEAEQTIQEQYNIPDFFPMSRDFAPQFTTADLPVTERFPNWETDPSIYENLDEVGFWDRFDITGDLVGDAPDLIEEQIQKGTESKFDWGNTIIPKPDLPLNVIQDDVINNLAQKIAAEENISNEEALETAEEEVEFMDSAPFDVNMFDDLYRSNKKVIPEIIPKVIPEIIPKGEGKEISNVSEIFENSETFNKNFELSTAYGEVLPESYAPGTTAYSLFQQLKEGFTDMSDDEILQKMIDNDMIKERPY